MLRAMASFFYSAMERTLALGFFSRSPSFACHQISHCRCLGGEVLVESDGAKKLSHPSSPGAMGPYTGRDPSVKKPGWLRQRAPQGERYAELKESLSSLKLNTVCEEAQCPNIGEVIFWKFMFSGRGRFRVFVSMGNVYALRSSFSGNVGGMWLREPWHWDSFECRFECLELREIDLKLLIWWCTSKILGLFLYYGYQWFVEAVLEWRRGSRRGGRWYWYCNHYVIGWHMYSWLSLLCCCNEQKPCPAWPFRAWEHGQGNCKLGVWALTLRSSALLSLVHDLFPPSAGRALMRRVCSCSMMFCWGWGFCRVGYVVLTSVDRDDMPDGGSDHFARTVKALKVFWWFLYIILSFNYCRESVMDIITMSDYQFRLESHIA